ncbi:MAG TPA: ABC transporter permease [Alphaproteobacteria bacterium]|nr:ABC transporter permease [Alphaproteobacteria bacterium]
MLANGSALAGARPRSAAPDVWLWVLLPTLAVLGLIFGLPLADLIAVSVHEMTGPAQVGDALTLEHYRAFVTDPFFLVMVVRTFWLGFLVVAFCLAIGYPVAYYLARTTSRWRGMALFLVISPLLVSAIVRNIGWFPILGGSGVVNWILMSIGLIDEPLRLISNFTGVVIGLVHALLPLMILTLTTVIQRVEPELEEAAANLGAGPALVFWRVLLPLSLPGVVAGSLLVFAMAISAYTTPAILGGNRVLVMSTYIAQQFRTVLDYPAGGTAAALLLLFAALLTLLALRVRTKGGEAG